MQQKLYLPIITELNTLPQPYNTFKYEYNLIIMFHNSHHFQYVQAIYGSSVLRNLLMCTFTASHIKVSNVFNKWL